MQDCVIPPKFLRTLAVWFITWIRSDKGSPAENREKAFQSRLLSRRATQKEYVIPRGQMEQILHAIHNLREIGRSCSTFTVLLLTFVTQRDRGTHILTQRKTEAGAENLAHHSREIRGWSHPETRGALHYGRAQAAETPSAPDYINPHLTAWNIFCWQSTSISCHTSSFPQIYRLNWINYI